MLHFVRKYKSVGTGFVFLWEGAHSSIDFRHRLDIFFRSVIHERPQAICRPLECSVGSADRDLHILFPVRMPIHIAKG
jgi:hypothetical protein